MYNHNWYRQALPEFLLFLCMPDIVCHSHTQTRTRTHVVSLNVSEANTNVISVYFVWSKCRAVDALTTVPIPVSSAQTTVSAR